MKVLWYYTVLIPPGPPSRPTIHPYYKMKRPLIHGFIFQLSRFSFYYSNEKQWSTWHWSAVILSHFTAWYSIINCKIARVKANHKPTRHSVPVGFRSSHSSNPFITWRLHYVNPVEKRFCIQVFDEEVQGGVLVNHARAFICHSKFVLKREFLLSCGVLGVKHLWWKKTLRGPC